MRMDVYLMFKKSGKWAIALSAAVVMLLAAGCSAGNKTVVSMKGGKITQEQYYESMKDSSAGKTTLQTLIWQKALENQYGKTVSDKTVNKQYNAVKTQYGAQFSQALAQNGMTASQFKTSIKTNLLTRKALEDLKKVTNADLKTQWKSYEPKITVSHILVKDEATAKDIINQLNKDNGKNFATLAKKYSTDTGSKAQGGKLAAFDSTDTQLDATFKKAAFALKQGEWTKTPVKTQFGYHVIMSDKNPGKGKMSDHTKELKTAIYDKWMQDSTVMQGVMSKVLQKANIDIKDKDLKDILSGYLNSSSSKSTATSSSKESSSKESSSSESSSSSDSSSTSSSSSSESSSSSASK
ncbi:peptidylprolyl isomerase [Schleiferilactobacillus perolens DSM 12744]|uniref:Foldase protein PrsA n=2 Tax=Schleiferilactobacillus perolens TaxID=100468 RepID=A0A0R1N9W0_9LACO|nr:peptidylprolyl isomerase [Schleiferilactobacillus perolens DSM 12744]